jgi:hypothetical protein
MNIEQIALIVQGCHQEKQLITVMEKKFNYHVINISIKHSI